MGSPREVWGRDFHVFLLPVYAERVVVLGEKGSVVVARWEVLLGIFYSRIGVVLD